MPRAPAAVTQAATIDIDALSVDFKGAFDPTCMLVMADREIPLF